MDLIERLSLGSEAVRAGLSGLSVIIADSPTKTFRDALDHLVESDDEIGRFVHHTLAETTRVPKLNVVVLKRGEPVLATTLRARQDAWEIATSTVAPTLRIPHKSGLLEPALSSLGRRILIVDYFGDATADFKRQRLSPFDSYVAQLNDFDFESYWRSTGIWRDIMRTGKKTADLRVVVDDPSTLEWSIDAWENRWLGDPSDEAGSADDLRAIWPELLRRKKITVTALVTQNGLPVASSVDLAHGDTLVGLITSRDTTLSKAAGSIGTRVLVESFDVARASGFAKIDTGGYHDAYKRQLTPAGRVAYGVEIAPRIIGAGHAESAERVVRRVNRGLRRIVRSTIRRHA